MRGVGTRRGALPEPDRFATSASVPCLLNGSNKAKESPFYDDAGKLLLYRIDGTRLIPVAAAWIGHWSQGAAFSKDGRTILVGNMVEKNVQVLHWNGTSLTDRGERIRVNGGSAALRTAGTP